MLSSILLALDIWVFLNFSHSGSFVVFLWVLIDISLVTNEIEYLLMYLLVIWMFSFVNSLLKCFAHFPNMLYFSYWYVRVLHTFWASHLLVIYLQMSSLYCVLPFLSVNGAFWWSEVLHFNVDSKLSVFSFLISSFCTCHKRCV